MLDRRALAGMFVGVTVWTLLGAGAHATPGTITTADEPQYLLSAISLVEDGDLDISDELAAGRWRAFHRLPLPRQTEPRSDGSELSPHDPLLPVLLAPGVALSTAVAGDDGVLAGARAVLALVAGALAATMLWTAVERLGVGAGRAAVVVAAFALPAPLAAYGSQVYPELPAALAVAVAAAALTGRGASLRRGRTAAWTVAVVALPWLGVKYVPVAAALAAIGLVVDRRGRIVAAAGLVAAGSMYLAVHQVVYGGWTVYAAGDHFVGGEFTVVGSEPDLPGRSVRLLGLLVDRHFGLVAWAPAWAVVVAAVGAEARIRDRTTAVLLGPLAAGWATATWVALTMHGWWWPGRQVVVVLPLGVLAVARLVARPRSLSTTVVVGALGALGAATWAWFAFGATSGAHGLIVDLDEVGRPWMRVWPALLPDERVSGLATLAGNVLCAAGLAALAGWGWTVAGRRVAADGSTGASRPVGSAGRDQDPLAGERADADGVPVDLDGRGAIG